MTTLAPPSTTAPATIERINLPPIAGEFSRLALGSWVFGGTQWGAQNVQDSRAVMEAALRRQINHIDTAAWFGAGVSEQLIGECLKRDEHRREHLLIATKLLAGDLTAGNVRQHVEASLARLGVEAIDLLYVDFPPAIPGRTPPTVHPLTPSPPHPLTLSSTHALDLRPIFTELCLLRDEGLVRGLGLSQCSVAHIEQAMEVCPLDVVQSTYNLLWRQAERELLPFCTQHQIAFIACGPLAMGILAGQFPLDTNFAKDDIRGKTVWFEAGPPAVWPMVHAAVEKMKALATEAKRPLTHLALRWLARNAAVRAIVAGARGSVQLNELAGAMTGPMDDAILDRLTAISDELSPQLPEANNVFRYCP